MGQKEKVFEPILLPTGVGDIIGHCRAAGNVGEDSEMHFKDIVGAHLACAGTIRLQPRSGSHNVLSCCGHNCGLALPIPIGIKTYAQLRKWCREMLPPEKRKESKQRDSLLV